MRWPAMRSADTIAAWMELMVFSRLTTTPLRRPSEGLSPRPRLLTGAPGSSDSAMTTATRDVSRSRPEVFFRRGNGCWNASWNVGMDDWRVGGVILAPEGVRGELVRGGG